MSHCRPERARRRSRKAVSQSRPRLVGGATGRSARYEVPNAHAPSSPIDLRPSNEPLAAVAWPPQELLVRAFGAGRRHLPGRSERQISADQRVAYGPSWRRLASARQRRMRVSSRRSRRGSPWLRRYARVRFGSALPIGLDALTWYEAAGAEPGQQVWRCRERRSASTR
jgi:hypothetical protein